MATSASEFQQCSKCGNRMQQLRTENGVVVDAFWCGACNLIFMPKHLAICVRCHRYLDGRLKNAKEVVL